MNWLVFYYFVIFFNWWSKGIYLIMVVIFVVIFYYFYLRFVCFEVFLYVFKCFRWYIGVMNYVMWLVYEFIKCVTGDIIKFFIGVFDMIVESGGWKKIEVRWIGDFFLSNRLVIVYKRVLFNSFCCVKCCVLWLWLLLFLMYRWGYVVK